MKIDLVNVQYISNARSFCSLDCKIDIRRIVGTKVLVSKYLSLAMNLYHEFYVNVSRLIGL